jgi:2-polyprenyl-6-methoxyphenol hydroxylase-like FAD-dependent oxidoreductase
VDHLDTTTDSDARGVSRRDGGVRRSLQGKAVAARLCHAPGKGDEMASVVVCGGGIVGMSAAMMLARDGHDVTVLEWDPALPPADPADAWDGWERRGVAQFRQPHNLLQGVRAVLDVELPTMVPTLLEAGCVWQDLLSVQPPGIVDKEPREGDERFRVPTGRRPVFEAAFAHAAEQTDGVTVRRGVEVTGLLTGSELVDGVPHVLGVRLAGGADLFADLVVDAMGRRSPAESWLPQIGGGAPLVESQECGFMYYTMNFRGSAPARYGPVSAPLGSFGLLTLDGDNGTWSVTFGAASGDRPLKELRHVETFRRVVRGCPLQAHWVDGEPITEVLAMAGVLDRYRRFTVDGTPIATGYAAVGDAWACTNPSAGRGISVGLMHAQALRDVVAEQLADPVAFAHAWDEATEARVTPYYRAQLAMDQARIAQMDAERTGQPAPPGDPTFTRLLVAAGKDGEMFRAMIELMTGMTPATEVLTRPTVAAKLVDLGDGVPSRLPGPDRAQLLELIAG